MGRTDKNGRFLFYPDKMGNWKVVVNDGIGHRLALETNIDKTLNLNKTGQQAESIKQSALSKYERALMGISIIFGISGIFFWWRGRRIYRRNKEENQSEGDKSEVLVQPARDISFDRKPAIKESGPRSQD